MFVPRFYKSAKFWKIRISSWNAMTTLHHGCDGTHRTMRQHAVDGCCPRRRVEILDDVHRLVFPTDLNIVVKRFRENISISDYQTFPTSPADRFCCFTDV